MSYTYIIINIMLGFVLLIKSRSISTVIFIVFKFVKHFYKEFVGRLCILNRKKILFILQISLVWVCARA